MNVAGERAARVQLLRTGAVARGLGGSVLKAEAEAAAAHTDTRILAMMGMALVAWRRDIWRSGVIPGGLEV